ncbi:MAG: phospholipase [Chloroflexi bacterium]|nr:phospholipase [Chloroflexota bacterium]
MSKRRSSRSTLTLILLAVMVALAFIYTTTGEDPLGLFTTTASLPPSDLPPTFFPGTQTGQPGWWEVYFTDPLNLNDPSRIAGSIEEKLISYIEAARASIHIASFEFDLTPVAEALIAAHARGVDVRWVTDDESGLEADLDPQHGQFAMLQVAGIEVRDDARTALMHNKFWIFDGYITWTGSTNVTENGIFKQDNNTIVIRSSEVAAMYEREFQEMWEGQSGITSPSTADLQHTTIDGTPVQVLFSPEDGVVNFVIERVGQAQGFIRFMAFSFTDYPLAAAMLARAEAGVDVSGVFERVGSDTEHAELRTLHCGGVPVRQDGNPSFLHHKVIIVDDTVITGSLNYSSNADENNDENVIIITNPSIAMLYLREFERVWSQAPATVEGIQCP